MRINKFVKQIIILVLVLGFNNKALGQSVNVTGKNIGIANLIFKGGLQQTHSQFIYLASEINKTGKINKLTFTLEKEISNTDFNKIKTWEVRLGTTKNEKFEEDKNWNADVTYLTGTALFDGDVTLLDDKKTIEVSLTNSFNYTSDNLVLDILEKSTEENPNRNNIKLLSYNTSYKDNYRNASKTLGYNNKFSSSNADYAVPKVTINFEQASTPSNPDTNTSNNQELKVLDENSFTCEEAFQESKVPARYEAYVDYGYGPRKSYPNSWSTMVYTPTDMKNKDRLIKTLGWYVSCNSSKQCESSEVSKQFIYMKMLDNQGDVIAPIGDRIDISKLKHPEGSGLNGYTKVYKGSVKWKSGKDKPEPTIITLDTDFQYKKGKYLIIYYLNVNNNKIESTTNKCVIDTPSFLSYKENDHLKAKYGQVTKDNQERDIYMYDPAMPWTVFNYNLSATPVIPVNLEIKTFQVNAKTCQANNFTTSGITVEPSDATLKWTASPSNSGTFDDNTSLNPTFTSKGNFKGNVTITLKVTKEKETKTKSFTLNVIESPVAKIVKKQ